MEAADRRGVRADGGAQRRTRLLRGVRWHGPAVSLPDATAVVHPLCGFPVLDRGAHGQRRGGGAGEFEHHRGGVGSMSEATRSPPVATGGLSADLRSKIQDLLPRYPQKQAVTLPAL